MAHAHAHAGAANAAGVVLVVALERGGEEAVARADAREEGPRAGVVRQGVGGGVCVVCVVVLLVVDRGVCVCTFPFPFPLSLRLYVARLTIDATYHTRTRADERVEGQDAGRVGVDPLGQRQGGVVVAVYGCVS